MKRNVMPAQFDTNRTRIVVKDNDVDFVGTFSKESGFKPIIRTAFDKET